MDQFYRIWLKARKHLSKIMLFVYVGLMGAIAWFLMQEATLQSPEPIEPPMWTPQEVIEPNTEITDFLTTFGAQVPTIQDTKMANLIVLNVWELREGVSAEDLQREALSLNQQAQQAYREGNLPRALDLARQASERDPSFTENNRFVERIQQELAGPQPSATPVTTP